jgi:hypothetical protein
LFTWPNLITCLRLACVPILALLPLCLVLLCDRYLILAAAGGRLPGGKLLLFWFAVAATGVSFVFLFRFAALHRRELLTPGGSRPPAAW